MPSLAQIDAARMEKPLFVKARTVEHALTCAIQLQTHHAGRLTRLRRLVRRALREANEQELSQFLQLYGPAFKFWIEAAQPLEVESRACVQSTVGMAA